MRIAFLPQGPMVDAETGSWMPAQQSSPQYTAVAGWQPWVPPGAAAASSARSTPPPLPHNPHTAPALCPPCLLRSPRRNVVVANDVVVRAEFVGAQAAICKGETTLSVFQAVWGDGMGSDLNGIGSASRDCLLRAGCCLQHAARCAAHWGCKGRIQEQQPVHRPKGSPHLHARL